MDKYVKYKNLFSCLNTQNDIEFFMSRCNPVDRIMINSIIKGLKKENVIGLVDMCDILDEIKLCKYKHEVNTILSRIDGCDNFQKDILDDIICAYPSYNQPKIKNVTLLTKKCPHCGRITTADEKLYYIVCGFDPQGITPPDDACCSNDWCFKCGKKLCKNWYNDDLYIYINQTHNQTCCKLHANKYKFDYPNDYCMCPQNRTQT